MSRKRRNGRNFSAIKVYVKSAVAVTTGMALIKTAGWFLYRAVSTLGK